jgi:hypothetical protein
VFLRRNETVWATPLPHPQPLPHRERGTSPGKPCAYRALLETLPDAGRGAALYQPPLFLRWFAQGSDRKRTQAGHRDD